MIASETFADASAILDELRAAANGRDLETVVPPLCRAAASVLAGFQQPSPLVPGDRYVLIGALRGAEIAARALLPAYFDVRGHQGCLHVLCLIHAWGGDTEATEPVFTAAELTSIALQTRIFVNDLDSLCVGLELKRTDPTALPLSALLGVPFSTDLALAATLH